MFEAIKETLSSVNKEQLSLYYGAGQYVSENSREVFWGMGGIEKKCCDWELVSGLTGNIPLFRIVCMIGGGGVGIFG